MIFEKTKRVLTITQIYHLNIFQKHILISVLIQLISLLPDLITLKIHSFLLNNMTMGDFLICCSMERTSKITKVYVEEIGGIRQLNLLFTLCPKMEYFKVRCINTMDVQSFLRTIFKNIHHNCCRHLQWPREGPKIGGGGCIRIF
jgi:hypothetical protein